jgi:mannose-1-phosphate guanylyltransferase
MAGGSGTRFWPASRLQRPKQLIKTIGNGTMIQQTVARLQPAVALESVLIITNAAQADLMREQLPELDPAQIVAEPVGRDTAAAIGLAALMVVRKDHDGVMVVLSADHIIEPAEALCEGIQEAAEIAAEHNLLVTFGVKPTGPNTRYGYLHRGEPISGAVGAYKLQGFKEKPDRETAEEYLRTGEYYWNSGNFVWRAADILEAIATYMPKLHAGLQRLNEALGTPVQDEVLAREYPQLPRISIDYGVMEKAPNAAVVEARFEWDDVGAWDAVARHHPMDENGNHVLAEHAGIDTKNCILSSVDGHLLATIGIEDLIVVHASDATLVCTRRRAPEVKELVQLLKARGLGNYL